MDYKEIASIIYEQIKDELQQKPKTKEEINNPMEQTRKDALYNAIFCYDENENICGYSIQVRLEEKDIYKLRFYLPIIDASWKGVRNPEDLPDKKIKIGFDGVYQSQNELLKNNDVKLGQAMLLNFNVYGITYIGEGFIGIENSDILYLVARRFKYTGYPINEATKKMNETKLFV